MMDGDFKASHGITKPFMLYIEFIISRTVIHSHSLTITDFDPLGPSMFFVWAPKGNLEDPLSSVKLGQRAIQTFPEGWVKVKVVATALNWHDFFTLRGISSKPLTFPRILGCGACGTLEDGTSIRIYPVMGSPTYHGDITFDTAPNFLIEETQGTLAEYVVVLASNAIPRPANLPVVSAGVIGVAWLTAYRILFTRSRLLTGQKMLVQDSVGGVSTALTQLGAVAGMRVWSTERTTKKRELVLHLGAERAFKPSEGVAGVCGCGVRHVWGRDMDAFDAVC
jgi:NADPH:quinone reductase-like Zn-dependent oxidoreductase